jgi:2-oxoisovalerate dehydrogenase E1 component
MTMNSVKLELFRQMILCRFIDDKMQKLIRQNKGGNFHLCTNGHEMIGALSALCLNPGKDWGLPYYRDRAFALALGADMKDLFATLMARVTKHHSGSRQMPEHFSHKELRIPCQSSVVGSQFLHAVGIALGAKLKGVDEVVYVSAGDGATSQGDFHEALNFSCIHKLPVLFVIQNNGLAISVPAQEQTAGGNPALFMRGYPGLSVMDIDGCNFDETKEALDKAIAKGRAGEGPSVIVARIPRMGAHSSSDDPKKYLSEEASLSIMSSDPLERFEKELLSEGILNREQVASLKSEIFQKVEEAALEADKEPHPTKDMLLDHLFAPSHIQTKESDSNGEAIVMVDAIVAALEEEMERDSGVVVFGQDVAGGKGGVFGATRGLTAKFGSKRCFNSPLAESTIIGAALGLSLDGVHKPVVEIQFADYIWTGINQLFNEVASICYRSNGEWNASLVIRMPIGGYIQGGPYHSQSIEGIIAHCPGLLIAYPSNSADAKRLLKAAIRDKNPVLFFEHKGLYRQRAFSARALPPKDDLLEFGKAKVIVEGKDLTLVTWGMMAVYGFEVANTLTQEGILVEVLDLRTLAPYDFDAILTSVKKTGKVLIAHEAPLTCGFGSEIAARLAEKAFPFLDAPIKRLAGADCPVAYSKILEDANLPQKKDLEAAIRELSDY